MLFIGLKNLLPEKLMDGVALKTLAFQKQLSRSGGLRRLVPKFSNVTKISLGALLAIYFAAYQPSFSIPPVKKSEALAQFTQQESIQANSFSEPIILPHPGYLTSTFSTRHPGVDIATGLGMPIRPILKGKVSEVVMGWFGLGHYVVVDHEQSLRSTYGHMGKVYTKVGDEVTQASILGEVGLTGRTSGAHTHLELTKDGKYLDPQILLPKIPDFPTYAKSNITQSSGNR